MDGIRDIGYRDEIGTKRGNRLQQCLKIASDR